jgi:hypothetical protein
MSNQETRNAFANAEWHRIAGRYRLPPLNQPTTSKETSVSNPQAAPSAPADPYREFVDEDAVTTPEPIRGDLNSIQLLTSTARVWWLRTHHPLAAVLADSFWETMKDVRLQKEDVIQTVSSFGSDQAEHSVLCVHTADKHGLATVRVLHRYLRAAA